MPRPEARAVRGRGPSEAREEADVLLAHMQEVRAEAERRGHALRPDLLAAEHGLPAIAMDVLWVLLSAWCQGDPDRTGAEVLHCVAARPRDRLRARSVLEDAGPLVAADLICHDGDEHPAGRTFHIARRALQAMATVPVQAGTEDRGRDEGPCASSAHYLDLLRRLGVARIQAHARRRAEEERDSDSGYGPPRWRRGRGGRWVRAWYDDDNQDQAEAARAYLARIEDAVRSEQASGRWAESPLGLLVTRHGLVEADVMALAWIATASPDTGDDEMMFLFGPPSKKKQDLRRRVVQGSVLLDVMAADSAERLHAASRLYAGAPLLASKLLAIKGKPEARPECLDYAMDEALARFILGHAADPAAGQAAGAMSAGPAGGGAGGSVCTVIPDEEEGREGLVERIIPTEKLADVVLPPEVRAPVEDSLKSLRLEGTLTERWGVSDKISYGTGCGFLFAGPPGTGKTFCARAVAGELGVHLFVVNVPKLMSMWVGGTEKNIQRVFEAVDEETVDGKSPVLFFDEADALFFDRELAARSWEVRDVTTLLTELERYKGVLVLATNRKPSLDEALERRVSVVIDFPKPDAAARKAILARLLPPPERLAGDVDLDALTNAAEVTGGQIKKAMLLALRLAEARGKDKLDQTILLEALRAAMGGGWTDGGTKIGFGN